MPLGCFGETSAGLQFGDLLQGKRQRAHAFAFTLTQVGGLVCTSQVTHGCCIIPASQFTRIVVFHPYCDPMRWDVCSVRCGEIEPLASGHSSRELSLEV